MELKFSDGVSRTFFSLGILNDEAWSKHQNLSILYETLSEAALQKCIIYLKQSIANLDTVLNTGCQDHRASRTRRRGS